MAPLRLVGLLSKDGSQASRVGFRPYWWQPYFDEVCRSLREAASPASCANSQGLQFCNRERAPASIRSHSTLWPTCHCHLFGSSNTPPTSVCRVAMPVVASRAVIVATTPVDKGGGGALCEDPCGREAEQRQRSSYRRCVLVEHSIFLLSEGLPLKLKS